MNNLAAAIWTEWCKARRSRVPLATALGIMLIPLVGAFMMFIYKDPEFARRAGLIGSKANLMAAVADWPTYLGLLTQATALGGIMLFGLVCSWVFGREFSDGTAKDLLALPVGRSSIIAAKFVVVALWSAVLTLEIILAGLIMGLLLALPDGSVAVVLAGTVRLALTALQVIAVVLPCAFFASAGRGYLPPVGFALVAVLFANVIATIGWGAFFPYSVPALYAGLGDQAEDLSWVSYGLVLLTAVAALLGTNTWWRCADQNR